jgi:hypothetical protein
MNWALRRPFFCLSFMAGTVISDVIQTFADDHGYFSLSAMVDLR